MDPYYGSLNYILSQEPRLVQVSEELKSMRSWASGCKVQGFQGFQGEVRAEGCKGLGVPH